MALMKPRSEPTPAELAKLDVDLSTGRNWRTKSKEKKAAADIADRATVPRAAQHESEIDEKEAIVTQAHTLLMLGLCRPSSTILSVVAMTATTTGSSVVRPPEHLSNSSSVTPGAYRMLPLHVHGPT
ncbi:hypothetical protein D1007_57164 [Hordeum vulgare]|nr:hypothetical protein D1007_57164 [Hordeum vulgare]